MTLGYLLDGEHDCAPLRDQVAGQTWKGPHGVRLDHLFDRGAQPSEQLEERSALLRPWVRGVVQPGPFPIGRDGVDGDGAVGVGAAGTGVGASAGSVGTGSVGQCAHASVAPGCWRAMPLRVISRWAVNSNSPEPTTSCSDE